MNKSNIPWVEKYRPDNLSDIVLDDNNKKIITNIIKNNYFPNILFHGPPGTGKTTTIINLIKSFLLTNFGMYNNSSLIHLNASDERGIDVVRNHITTFINAENLFFKSLKFVVLDEADYMTKAAQLQLKEIIQKCTNTRFCIICNYISKIERSLKHEFVSIAFNRVPSEYITSFLSNILVNESSKVSAKNIENIKDMFDPDIRSMINFLQLNFKTKNTQLKILNDDSMKELLDVFLSSKNNENGYKLFLKNIHTIMNKYNSNYNTLIKQFIMYIMKTNHHLLNNSSFIDFIENIVHNVNKCDKTIEYFYITLFDFF